MSNDTREALAAERAAFEEFIARDGGDLSTFGSGAHVHYRNSAVNNAWTGWTARAALATPAAPAQAVPLDEDRIRHLWDKACRTVTVQGGGNDVLVFADYLTRELRGAAPAAPAQAVPLTEEQIDQIADDGHRNAVGGIYATAVYQFAAAIERAHGIAPKAAQEKP